MISAKNLAILALLTVLPTGCSPAPGRGARNEPGVRLSAKITHVIDGDTIMVAAGERRVRLLGIDAPEDTRRRECFGGQATAALRRLLPPGSTVLLYLWRRADPYGRDLALAWRADGVFVNRALVRGGYAVTRFLPPADAHGNDLIAAEDQARSGRTGLWRACRSRRSARAPPSTLVRRALTLVRTR